MSAIAESGVGRRRQSGGYLVVTVSYPRPNSGLDKNQFRK